MAIQILNFAIGLNVAEIHKYVLGRYVSPLFGAKTGDPRYDERVDIDKDGLIDITDIASFARDPELTFKTFGITPVLWYKAALPAGICILAITGVVIALKKR